MESNTDTTLEADYFVHFNFLSSSLLYNLSENVTGKLVWNQHSALSDTQKGPSLANKGNLKSLKPQAFLNFRDVQKGGIKCSKLLRGRFILR